MPKHLGQWTGIVVTAIVVLGCDMDVAYAVPLGILSGAIATFFVMLADSRKVSETIKRRLRAGSN